MKSIKKVQMAGRSKKSNHIEHIDNERLVPSEVKNKTAGLAEQGRYVGKRWYPQAKAKR